MIPATYEASNFKISFKAQVYLLQGDGGLEQDYTEITAMCQDYTSNAFEVSSQIELKPACSYNFKVELGGNLEPIKFSVEKLGEWTPDTQYTGKIN